ncbi:integrase catalytic domain-containing protein [Trichonephila clavipes]|nr:integrase catalytic domain-containing protein [Trichonephila clavipes]
MEVNALKAARKGLRIAFSLSLKKIETEFTKENIDMNQLSILKAQIMDKFQRLDTCQNQISEQLLGTEDAVQEYLDDMEDAENYRDRYIEICTRVDLKIRETVVPTETEKRNGKFFEDYKSVFRQRENLNIIERVPEVELNNECHYLPHRPVIKLDSATTKIRPVFDASARENGKPSLNDCLYKSVNLIELIPDILDRFRIYPVGIVADIEKAFLILSVAPKDRDYLRFFFPCNEKQLVYRHCRVVFGVSSSPYLLNASIMHLLENCNSNNVGTVYIAPKITIAGNMENEKGMGSGTTSEYCKQIYEMVLIGNDNKNRLSWPIAKIIELIPGRDGEIRTVRLKTQHGTVIRPVQRIFPLEIQAIANNNKELKEESVSVKSTKPEKVLNINDAIIKKIYFFWKIG